MRWPRVDARRVLAVSLTVVMLLSLLAVPVAAAPPDGAGDGNGNGGNDAGSSSGGGSSSNGGGNSGGDSGGSNSGGGNDAGSGSNGGSGSGNDGGSDGNSGGGNNAGSSSNGNNGNSGSGNEAGSSSSGNNGNSGNSNSGNAAGGNGNAGNAGEGSSDGSPGNSGSAGPPDNAGPSDDQGPPENAGPPDETGQPDDAGQPDETGPPDQAGPPTVAVSTGPPDNTGDRGPPASPPGQSDGPSPPSVVDVAVSGANAGDEVTMDVSTAAAADDSVAFDGISVQVKRGGDFTMRVTNSEEALPGSPEFEPPEAAEALGRVRLDHSITNEEVEDVSFTFRVSKERLSSSDTDPEEVALYRFSDGGWATLQTDAVGETDTHYLFKADSPGMSEFAIGAKRPEFDTYWADAEAATAAPGETVSVSGRISNVGAADGVYEASLVVDGEIVSTRAVTIAAGGTRQVNFQTDFDESGSYEIAVDDVSAGEVSVKTRSARAEEESLSEVAPVSFDRLMDVGRSLGTTVVSLVSVL